MLTDRFDRALTYATAVHGGHVRKGTATPYVAHLLIVTGLVPGCVAVADTREEAERLIEEAIAEYLQGMREDGIAVPPPVTQVATGTVE